MNVLFYDEMLYFDNITTNASKEQKSKASLKKTYTFSRKSILK